MVRIPVTSLSMFRPYRRGHHQAPGGESGGDIERNNSDTELTTSLGRDAGRSSTPNKDGSNNDNDLTRRMANRSGGNDDDNAKTKEWRETTDNNSSERWDEREAAMCISDFPAHIAEALGGQGPSAIKRRAYTTISLARMLLLLSAASC